MKRFAFVFSSRASVVTDRVARIVDGLCMIMFVLQFVDSISSLFSSSQSDLLVAVLLVVHEIRSAHRSDSDKQLGNESIRCAHKPRK